MCDVVFDDLVNLEVFKIKTRRRDVLYGTNG